MSISLKKDTRKTNIKHNNRNMNDKDKLKNDHIDFSRSGQNKYLVQENIKDLYQKEFGEAQNTYNEKQKRQDRKIKNYYKHVQQSKKTSVQQEMILQIGDKDDFEQYGSDNWRLTNQVLEEWFQGFQERNPNLKVYNCAIHNDEASPHMHLNFVPVASGYKRGMEKQVSFDKAILQQDAALDKTRPFDDWREKEIGVLTKLLKERGIERKLVGTNQYVDVNDFKTKQRELELLDQKIDEIKLQYQTELDKFDQAKHLNTDPLNDGTIVVRHDLMPHVDLKKMPVVGKWTVDPGQVQQLQDWGKKMVSLSQRDHQAIQEQRQQIKKMRGLIHTQDAGMNKIVERKLLSERQRWSSDRFDMQRSINRLERERESLERAKNDFQMENKVLRKWKNRATAFMDKIGVLESFEKLVEKINKKIKNRAHDLER